MPPRILTEPLPGEPSGYVCELDKMLPHYYTLPGRTGAADPSVSLERLDLDEYRRQDQPLVSTVAAAHLI